jgi:adhesin transport system outer membrane protein
VGVLLLTAALGLAGCGWLPGSADAPPATEEMAPGATEALAPRLPPSLAATEFGRDVAQAVLTHPALGAGNARVRAAEAELDAERSVFLPQLAIGADSVVSIAGDTSTRSTPIVQVEQLLFDGGAARARTEAARARIDGSESDRVGTASGLALRAVEAAFTLQHERVLLALAERDLELHVEFLAQIEDRVSGGVGTEADLLSANSRTADARARRASALARLERAAAAYVEAFGTPPPAQLATTPAPALPEGDDRLLISTSPRLESLNAQLEAARAEQQSAEASRLPRLSVAVLGGRREDGGGGADVAADFRLRYDLSTGGQRQARIRAASARVSEVADEKLSLERQLALSLEQVRADLRSGAERRSAARAALEANRAAVQAADEQFRVGRRSIGQLLDAQRDFVAASETLARVELDIALAGYSALALTGDILNVFGVELPPATPEDL